jgi:hypothetical protein
VHPEDQKEIARECLNGERERDCSACPAHHSQGGICCFGKKHAYGDPDCADCIHETACARVTHGFSGSTRVPVRTSARPSSHINKVTAPQSSTKIARPLLSSDGAYDNPITLPPEMSGVKKFLVVSGWGALEGFFELGGQFIRGRRPR